MLQPRLEVVIAAALIAIASSAHAQVYKCTDAAGKTTYSDAPCDGAAKPLKLAPDPTRGTTTNPNVCAQLEDEMLRLAAEAESDKKKGQKEVGPALREDNR